MSGDKFLKELKNISEYETWYMVVNDTRVYLKIYSTKLVRVLTQVGERKLDTMDLIHNKFYKAYIGGKIE